MNAQEFEDAVREMRRAQRRFFHLKKDDPDRENSKRIMREREKVVLDVTQIVMAIRPKNKRVENEREQFFLDVVEMLRRQKTWMMQGGGSWMMNPAREKEKVVDLQMQKWDDIRREEERIRREEIQKKQLTIFQNETGS